MINRSWRRSARFSAPWGKSVWLVTGLVCLLCLSMAVVLPLTLPPDPWWLPLVMGALTPFLFAIVFLFAVRGYSLDKGHLWIHRPFWRTHVNLDGLQKAYADPKAMKSSFRTAGNGGFFAFTGSFRNKRLGSYRAWVTDPARSVVLVFSRRTVVISPSSPRKFLRALGVDPEQP